MVSEGAQLRAAGASVTLADGIERRLRFTMDSLLEIEEGMGSLVDYLDGISSGFRGLTLKALSVGLAAGLRHDKGITPDLVKALLFRVMGRWEILQGYVSALDAAWDEAVPAVGARDRSDPKASSNGASASLGRRSTPRRSARAESVPASSGA